MSNILKRSIVLVFFLLLLQGVFPSQAVAIVSVLTRTVNLNPTADTSIIEFNAGANFGAQQNLWLGTYFGAFDRQGRFRILLKFDLSEIPAGATIDSALLNLKRTSSTHNGYGLMRVYRVARVDWKENIVTWNTRPDWIDPGNVLNPGENEWFWSNVKDIVKLWYSGTQPNYGFYILAPLMPSTTPIDTLSQEYFASRENNTIDSRPYLSITYYPPPNTPLVVPELNTTKLDLSDQLTVKKILPENQPDNTPPQISTVRVSVTQNSAEITWTTDEPATSQVFYGQNGFFNLKSPADSALVTSHKVTLSDLQPGQLYSFEVFSADTAGNSEHSMADNFTTLAATTRDNSQSSQSETSNQNISETLNQRLSDAVVEEEIKKSAGATESAATNPIVLLAQKFGVNKIVGTIFLIVGLISLLVVLIVFKISHKTFHKVKSRLEKNKLNQITEPTDVDSKTP